MDLYYADRVKIFFFLQEAELENENLHYRFHITVEVNRYRIIHRL